MKIEKRKMLKSSIFILVATVLLATAFLFVGCRKKDYGSFIQDEILMSVDDEIDLRDYYEYKDVENIFFESQDKSILDCNQNTWTALSSGSTVVYAYADEKQVDYINIFVKSSFGVPSNISLDDEGNISWNKCFVVQEGVSIEAKYEIEINRVDIVESVIQKLCDSNSYKLEKYGIYDVRVRAVETERIDGTEFRDASFIRVYYNAMHPVSNLIFEPDETGESSGILSWVNQEENSNIKVLMNGVVYASFSDNENSINIPTGSVSSERNMTFEVVTLDALGQKIEASTKLTIKKLEDPQASFEGEKLVWNDVAGAEKYKIYTSEGNYFTENTLYDFSGIERGIFTFGVQAIGGTNTINSDGKVLERQVKKLDAGSMLAEVDGEYVKFTFSSNDSDVTDYEVYRDGEKIDITWENLIQDEDQYIRTGKSKIPAKGEFDFSYRCIPNKENRTYYCVSSNRSSGVKAYSLEKTRNVSHDVNNSGESILSFSAVEFANLYKIKIKGFNESWFDLDEIESETVEVNIGVLDTTTYSKFSIIVVSSRKTVEGEIVFECSSEEKILTVFENPQMKELNRTILGKVEKETNIYTWEGIESVEYEYVLTKTNSDFEEQEILKQEIISQNSVEVPFGYYKLQVRALSTDKNNYLDAPSYIQDEFYVSEQISTPNILLKYGDINGDSVGEYYLEMSKVQNSIEYEIEGFGKATVGSNNNVKFILGDLDQVKTYNISVVAVGADSLINTDSEKSNEIIVTRLAKPTIESVDKSEKVYFNIPEGGESLEHSTGEAIQGGVDISTTESEKRVYVYALGIKPTDEKLVTEGYSDRVCLMSETAEFIFRRSTPPNGLEFVNNKLLFTHSTNAESYTIYATVSHINGETSIEYDTTEKSVNISDIYSEVNNITSVKFTVKANINEEISGTWYLTSQHSEEINVGKLNKISDLSYNVETKQLLWSSLGENVTYKLYKDLDDDPFVETDQTSYVITEEINKDITIYIIATGINTINSSKSNEIVLRPVGKLNNLLVSYNNDGDNGTVGSYSGSIDASQLIRDNISDIKINGYSSNIVDNKLKIEEITGDVIVEVIPKDKKVDGNKTNYYIRSSRTYSLNQLSCDEGNITVDNKKIVVSATHKDSNAVYEIEVWKEESFKKNLVFESGELILNNSFFTSLEKGVYTLKLNLIANNQTVQSNGVYGKVSEIATGSIEKLTELTINTTWTNGETVESEKTKKLNVSFDKLKEDTLFEYEVYVNNSLAQTFTTESFDLSQNLFVDGINVIKIVTIGNGYISSVTEKSVEKFVKPVVEISDEGNLVFESIGEFLVEVYNKSVLLFRENLSISASNTLITSLRNKIDTASGVTGSVVVKVIKLGQTTVENAINTAYLPSDVCELEKEVIPAPDKLTISEQGTKITISYGEETYANEVELTIVSAKLAGADVYKPTISGQSFDLPNNWGTGVYSLQIQAKRAGKITSKIGEVELNVERLETPNITLSRGSDLTDIVISWESIEDSENYALEIKAQGNALLSIKTTSTSYSISNLEIPAGEIEISLIAVGESSGRIANSMKQTKVVNKLEQTISNLQADEKGCLAWEDSVENNSYVLKNETTATTEFVSAKVYEPNLSCGDYKFSVRIRGDLDETIDSDPLIYDSQVPQQISLVLENNEANLSINTGKISFNVGTNEGDQENFKLFIKYNNQVFDLSDLHREINNEKVSLYIADIIETIGLTEGSGANLKLILYTTVGSLKSKDTEKIIPAWDSQSTISLKDKSKYEDYISLTNNSEKTIENLQVRIKKVLNNNVEAIEYYEVTVKDNNPKVSLEETEIAYILDSVEFIDAGIYKISVSGTAGSNDSNYTQLCWTEDVEVTRLASVNDFKNTAGLLSWKDLNQAPASTTNFKLIFSETDGTVVEMEKAADELSITEDDLMELKKDRDYKVVIYALSTEKGHISSYKCAFTQDEVVRCANPNTELTLENGELFLEWGELVSLKNKQMSIMFEEADNLLQILDWYENQNSVDSSRFVSLLTSKHFSSPISFKFTSLNKTDIVIKFSGDAGEKELTQSAICLLRNLKDVQHSSGKSYYDILEEIANNTGNSTIRTFVGWLNNSKYFTGVANQKIVFDDIGNYDAEDITKGNYKIFIRQLQGEIGNYRVLRSEYIEKISSAEVVEAPLLSAHSSTKTVDITSTIKRYIQYYLDFEPLEGFTNYTLILYNENTRFVFNIVNSDGWKLSLDGGSGEFIELIDNTSYISIPLNTREEVSGIDSLDSSIYGYDYKATLFANAIETAQFNSKSDYYDISFRDFDLSAFKVQQGEFSWAEYFEVYVLLHNNTLSYKCTSCTRKFNDSSFTGDLKDYLKWNWIQFNIVGSLDTTNKRIVVDSPLYTVENVNSSPAPEISITNNGNILIKDQETKTERQYRISNNRSGNLYYLTDQVGYSYTYQPGTNFYNLNNDNKSYKNTEINSDEFYVYNIGTKNAIFTKGSFENGSYSIEPSETIYLKSKMSNLNANMLNAPSNIATNDEGKLTWESEYSTDVKYQLKIIGYRQTKDGGGNIVYTIYSSKILDLESKEIDLIKELDDKIDFYSFEIRTIPSLDLIDKLGSEVVYFGTSENPKTRTSQVTNLTAYGTIKWNDSDNTRFKVYSGEEGNGSLKWEEVEGILTSGYSFVPTSLVGNYTYSLGVRSFKAGYLPSKLNQFVNSVYKLPTMVDDDISVTENEDKYLVSFEKYAERINMYGGSRSYYSVLVDGKPVDVYEIDKNSVPENIEMNIQVTYEGKTYLIIASDAFTKTLEKADVSQIENIEWDLTNSLFKWTKTEGASYDIEIVTKYDDYEETRRYEGFSENEFSPTLMGEITSFKVRLRNGNSNIPSDYKEYTKSEGEDNPKIAIFAGGDGSKDNPYLVETADQFRNISTKLIKPLPSKSYYKKLIENGTTIRYDGIYNETDEVYYFKQTANITLGSGEGRMVGEIVEGEFGGVYDGENYCINIYAESGDITSTALYIYNLDRGTEKKTYSKGFSLFTNISSSGVVKNVRLNIDYKETQTNSLICGICLINNGTIKDSIIQNITFSNILDSIFAGFAGRNNGTMCNVGVESGESPTFSTTSSKDIEFKFAGVCVANYGELIKCYNEKDIIFELKKTKAVRIAGVVLSNFKSMYFCYNSGNINVNTNGTDYAFGIVEYNNGTVDKALLSHCYNSGEITGDVVGGVAGYFGAKSKISNIFLLGSVNGSKIDTKLLAYNYSTPANDWAEDIYAPTNYDVQNNNLVYEEITETTKSFIVKDISYTLKITQQENEYLVVIS